ncbi:MAG: tRNA uridine-5-carboxymethylaminomethyl(34) synthesis enzyme MnmG [Phycisphaerae bacterium]
MTCDFDIVVIGGGHAGIEAAHAAARLGAATALLTLHADTIGQMSCNPAIGGVGKGQIVREIDALGGLMGVAADATGIQFRMLNRSKGPAVWGPRCQSDRHAYARFIRRRLGELANLTILEGEAVGVLAEEGRAVGLRYRPTPRRAADPIRAEGASLPDELHRAQTASEPTGAPADLRCRAVVVTAGTFLNGTLHLGQRTWAGGRYGEAAAAGLSASLAGLGLRLGRMKTGTCPRLDATTIDTDRCTRQDGDDRPAPFSFLHESLQVRQIPCWLSATTPEIHRVIRENFHRAPLYTGQIQSTGPRYCPSIETKLDKFPDKSSHQVFLEPEGRHTEWVYVNGISTSLPIDVQDYMVHHIPGLENARVIRWGYAIEYDYLPPTQLKPTLETKPLGGLYVAGQLCGTTGYEEAAGQGLLAGVNATRTLRGEPAVVLRRDEAYIGVMIDDLVTKDVTEPYRMFTSRAEHRLLLRADNADRRLTPLGREIGLVDDARWQRHSQRSAAARRVEQILRTRRDEGRSLWELLQRPDMTTEDAVGRAGQDAEELRDLLHAEPSATGSIVVDARYAGYLRKQADAVETLREMESRPIPDNLDYDAIAPLRIEARQRLSNIRPRNLGQALRVSGITPSDVTVLSIHLVKIGAAHTPEAD